MTRPRQSACTRAHFGDTVLLVPKKIAKNPPKSPKITNWPIIQEDSRKISLGILLHISDSEYNAFRLYGSLE